MEETSSKDLQGDSPSSLQIPSEELKSQREKLQFSRGEGNSRDKAGTPEGTRRPPRSALGLYTRETAQRERKTFPEKKRGEVTSTGKHRLMESPSEAPQHGGSPWKGILITASFFSCWIQPKSAQGALVSVVPRPPYGTVGSNVTLMIQGYSGKVLSYNWYKKTIEHSNRIITYTVPFGEQTPVENRERGFPNGSLLIPNLTLNDTEVYIVQIVDSEGVIAAIEQAQFRVYEELVNPNIAVNSTNIIENDSLALTCSTENKEENILWFFNNQPLTLNERMKISKSNETLTIMNAKRKDTGSYQCEVWNPISSKKSDPLTLILNYGPDHIEILQSPENGEIEVPFNDSLTLECQALSYPPAQYEFHINDTSGPIHSGSTYTIMYVSWEHSGEYTCWARNNMTNISISKDVTVKVENKSPGGAIIGIVIGGLVGVVLTAVLICFLFFRKMIRVREHHLTKHRSSAPKHSQVFFDSSINETEETFYASLNFSAQKLLALTQAPTSTDIVYSKIKIRIASNLDSSRDTSRVGNWALYRGDRPEKGKMELPGKEKAVICRGKHRLMERPSKGPHVVGSPWKVLLITASILSCWIQPTSAQGNPTGITSIPSYGTVGSNVILTISGFTEKGNIYSWYRKTTEASNHIASYTFRTRVQTPEDIREKVLRNGALLIPNLSLSDADTYIVEVTIYKAGVGIFIAKTQLRVYEKLARPNITVNSIKIRENEPLVFTCSTENERANILWFFNNQPLPLTERTDPSENNQTLTIKSVKREDTGFYQCEVWNPIDAKRSNPLSLTVNYGPDNIKIFQSPESEKIEVQFNDSLTLECQAPSNPPVQYEWHANGSPELIHSGSTYTIPQASWEHSGKYTCWARNNVTNLSFSKNITVKVVVDKYPGGGKGSSLSGGAIIGIVIGELAGIVLIGALIYFLFIRKTGWSSKYHLPEKKHSTPKNGEDTTLYENAVCLKGSAILAQGQGSSPTLPEVLSEKLYESLIITTEDGYEKIIPSENPQDEQRRKSY
ncbi:uncharacterized protein LOC123240852 [Gracilinanus agilis]|uniref:uncharacterized protein LOC123240852 n=1 Tax=Gracilinanus agilis TaxID=191870 RepID=UPI001CFD65D1|nr:uncharacterized protein LOC123240852 [Gracilinanus agilis]